MPSSSNPSLSVVIPTHRRPVLVLRAVTSALAAVGKGDEVIVVADHDPEAAAALADMRHDPRLRFVVNEGQGGASATRNLGVALAQGETVLFLDDDDELAPEYPSELAGLSARAGWGFAAQAIRGEVGSVQPPDLRRFWLKGLPPGRVPFRRKLAALSAGFWVRRDLYLALGGLEPSLVLDEDTDLCCRLLAQGHQPWFTPMAGVVLDRGAATPRLTSQTDQRRRAECYLMTCQRNIDGLRHEKGAARHLAMRAQRMILRSGARDLQHQLDTLKKSAGLRFELAMKRWGYALRFGK